MFLEVTTLDNFTWLLNADQIVSLVPSEAYEDIFVLELISFRGSPMKLGVKVADALRYKLLFPDERHQWSSPFVHVEKCTINLCHIVTMDVEEITFSTGDVCALSEEAMLALKRRLLQPWFVAARPDGIILPETVAPTFSSRLSDEPELQNLIETLLR